MHHIIDCVVNRVKVWFIASFLVPLWPASCDLEGGRGVQRKLTPHSQHQRIYCAADMSSPKSKKRRSGAAPAVGASASSGAAIAGGGTATARVGATEMEGGCIACGGSDHSHCTCVLVGAALYSWMLQLGPGKDMTLVVDIILRLLMWGWREARFGEEITCLSYTAVGDIISAGGSEGSVFFMSAQTGEILCLFRSHSKDKAECICEFYPSGNLKRGFRECPVTGHSGIVTSVAWNNDGTKLVSGSWDETGKIWSVGSAGAFECQSTLTVVWAVTSVAFSPNGSIIAVAYFKKIQLFDAQTQAKLGSPLNVDSQVESVAFSPDGSFIAAAYRNKIQLFDAQTQEKRGSPLSGHSDR
jgi:WD40 repeat protein